MTRRPPLLIDTNDFPSLRMKIQALLASHKASLGAACRYLARRPCLLFLVNAIDVCIELSTFPMLATPLLDLFLCPLLPHSLLCIMYWSSPIPTTTALLRHTPSLPLPL